MTVCIPKHIACEWWNPETDGGFVAGPESCVLSVFQQTRARLVKGGAFFRSTSFGPTADTISITSTWQVGEGSPVVWRDFVSGSDPLTSVGQVKLIVTVGSQMPIEYTAAQTYTTSPNTWDVSAIDGFRTKFEGVGSPLVYPEPISLPITDNIQPWVGATDDADHLGEFTATFLSGGEFRDADDNAPDIMDIRTGPAFTMIYIGETEDDVGERVPGDGIVRYYNGACWKVDDLANPDCAVFTGSPPTPDCSGGAVGNCP